MITTLYFGSRLFSIVVVCTCFIKVSSIQCYSCSVKTSWKECDENLLQYNCSNIRLYGSKQLYDTCIKQHIIKPAVGVNGTKYIRFVKMCTKRDICARTEQHCKTMGYYCKVDCCNTDFCNQASNAFQVSVLVCMSCALILFFMV